MGLQPLKRQGISEDISYHILDLIKSGYFKPGEKLPTESELAETLQVSRPSLREAMRSLAFMNVIEIRQGSGTFVTSLEPELLVKHLDFVFSIGNSNPYQLLQARQIVEPQAAALAAKVINAVQLQELQAIVDSMLSVETDLPALVDLDVTLHNKITYIAGNPLLSRFMASIAYLDRATRLDVLQAMLGEARDKQTHLAHDDHQHILAALRAHDPEAAQQAMTQHLKHVENVMRVSQHIRDHEG